MRYHFILSPKLTVLKKWLIKKANKNKDNYTKRKQIKQVVYCVDNNKSTHHIDKTSTATSAFFKYPANRTKDIKYHVSKL